MKDICFKGYVIILGLLVLVSVNGNCFANENTESTNTRNMAGDEGTLPANQKLLNLSGGVTFVNPSNPPYYPSYYINGTLITLYGAVQAGSMDMLFDGKNNTFQTGTGGSLGNPILQYSFATPPKVTRIRVYGTASNSYTRVYAGGTVIRTTSGWQVVGGARVAEIWSDGWYVLDAQLSPGIVTPQWEISFIDGTQLKEIEFYIDPAYNPYPDTANTTFENNTYENNTYHNNTYVNNTYQNDTYHNVTYENSTYENHTHINNTYINYTNITETPDTNYFNVTNTTQQYISGGNITNKNYHYNTTYDNQTIHQHHYYYDNATGEGESKQETSELKAQLKSNDMALYGLYILVIIVLIIQILMLLKMRKKGEPPDKDDKVVESEIEHLPAKGISKKGEIESIIKTPQELSGNIPHKYAKKSTPAPQQHTTPIVTRPVSSQYPQLPSKR